MLKWISPRLELALCSLLWFSSFIYSFVKVHQVGDELRQQNRLEPNDFRLNERFGRDQDVSDYDWIQWTTLLSRLLPFTILHLILTEVCRKIDRHAVPLVHAVVTLTSLVKVFSPVCSVVLLVKFWCFFVLSLTGSKYLVWALSVSCLFLMNHLDLRSVLGITYDEMSLLSICLGWFHIKCVDFALSEVTYKTRPVDRLLSFVGYAFYLPGFFLGPFIPYSSFKEGLYRCFKPWDRARILTISLDLGKLLLWYTLFEAGTLYFYCHAMHYKVDLVVDAGLWTLNGVGLCMAQFFFFKYLVVYGASLSISKAELYNPPPGPKCIYRIHLYSNMWRHFDRGFYLFLINCIYRPILGGSTQIRRRLFASFLCFSFVFIWHGVNITVFIWSALNFLGVAIEGAIKAAKSSRAYDRLRHRISNVNLKRLESAICSPLWVMAVISNFIFFGGHELGMVYLHKVFSAPWTLHLFLFTVGYAMCQISVETTLQEQSKR